MSRWLSSVALGLGVSATIACSQNPVNPAAPATLVQAAGTSAAAGSGSSAATSNGPETPPFNLEAVLRPSDGGSGFGLVKFRQPNDDARRVYLDTWVRDLAPATEYRLERAVDAPDGTCTSEAWLTLGHGLAPATLVTDERGTARELFFRDLPPTFDGQLFDIHFRIVDLSGAEVLRSGCYQYVVEPD